MRKPPRRYVLTGDPLRRPRPIRTRGYFTSPPDYDGDYSLTADQVFDGRRRTIATATGVLDARGEMLFRVVTPIKGELGFGRKVAVPDCLEMIIPEDDLPSLPGALREDHEGDYDEEEDDDE